MSYMFLAWAYEYRQFMAQAGQGRERVEWNRLVRFREEVNEPRLMHYSHMHSGSIDMRVQRHGTLVDRDYEWIRTGVRGTQRPTYILEPLDQSPMPPELEALRASLPRLEDVALGRVRTLADGGRRAPARRGQQVVDVPPAEAESEGDGEAPGDWLDNPFGEGGDAPPRY